MKRIAASLLFGMLVHAAPAAAEDAYPTRAITMIVPFAAGGPTDVTARIVGEHMSRTLGQQIVIENVAGAGGTTGISRAAAATPDGYTIMMGHMGTHGAAPAVYPNLKYNPTKDFEPTLAPSLRSSSWPEGLPARTCRRCVAYVRPPARSSMTARLVGRSRHDGRCFHSILACSPTCGYRVTGPAANSLLGRWVQFDYMCTRS